MSGRAATGVVVAVIVLAAAVSHWRSSPPDRERAAQSDPAADAVSDPAISAAPGARGDWFPELSDSASTVTTGVTGSMTSRRFDCSLEDLAEEVEDDDYRERNRQLAETLSRSANAEDLLAAVIIGAADGGDRRIDSLSRALAADPTHPLVLWRAAYDCRSGRGGEYCSNPSVRANLEAVLGSNGWYWTQVAAFYYEQGMFDQALQATQRAVSAPEFDDYYIDHVLLLERALSADSDRAYIERVVEAIGYAASMPSDFLVRQCTLRSETDDAWLDSCTMLAERYEQDGTNLLMQLIGLGMQEDLYARSGLIAEIDDAQRRKSELEGWLARVDADYQLVQAVDPQLMARYLDVWAASGEVAAFEFAVSAVDELLEDPDYDPCVYLPSR